MVNSSLLIALIIIAITQMVKRASPKVTGWITILVAFVISILISLLSFALPTELIGIDHVSIGSAIVAGLEAIGITVIAKKAGGGSSGDGTPLIQRQ